MTSALISEYMTYGIYRDASPTQAWASTTGTKTSSSIGSGAEQNSISCGRLPVQTAPAAQSCIDTIIVAVAD